MTAVNQSLPPRSAIPRDRVPVFFECCRPVRGASRGALFDLQREKYVLVPNDLLDVVQGHGSTTVAEKLAILSPEDGAVYLEYLDFLEGLEYIFFADPDELDRFPPLDTRWDSPATITNAIIEFRDCSEHDLPRLVAELEGLQCQALELRFYESAPRDRVFGILELIATTGISCIYLKCQTGCELDDPDSLQRIDRRFFRVVSVEFFGGQRSAAVSDLRHLHVAHYGQPLTSAEHCGVVDRRAFVVGGNSFLEALNHNSCLNRKVAVASDGSIRNCPAMATNYGAHGEHTLAEVVATPEFQRIWAVTKDQVAVCRDCEFRYVCTDCRALQDDPTGAQLGKPTKCNYDPYTATWN